MMNNKKLIIIIAAEVVVVFSLVAFFFASRVNSSNRLSESLDLGNRYLTELKYEEAAAAFLAAIDIDPKCAEAYMGAADAYIGMGDYDEALAILAQGCDAVEDESDNEKLNEARAEVEEQEEEAAETEENIPASDTQDIAESTTEESESFISILTAEKWEVYSAYDMNGEDIYPGHLFSEWLIQGGNYLIFNEDGTFTWCLGSIFNDFGNFNEENFCHEITGTYICNENVVTLYSDYAMDSNYPVFEMEYTELVNYFRSEEMSLKWICSEGFYDAGLAVLENGQDPYTIYFCN